jgi:hypothetical protein
MGLNDIMVIFGGQHDLTLCYTPNLLIEAHPGIDIQ